MISRVVVRVAQKRSYPLEGFDESREIRVVVAGLDLFGRDFHIVARRKFDGGFRPNRAFEVEVKLRFRKRVDDRRASSWLWGRLCHEFRFIAKAMRAARVDPRRHPVGPDVGGSVGKLPHQHRARLCVEPVVIFISITGQPLMRAAIREQHVFKPRMRAEGHLERMVRGIAK